ncbi:ABC transporter substrate-binding protein [Phaeobacter gallaeciensis]|uniref:ABC transporter substrate-binding protein n=1 Tax=Phaeobacter gallaeciensis TaxID=60890 RepID=UPI000BBCF246|nr:ABC transporter substrate-binding protein [Phaeobacter gallaeciensis]ATF19279.1 ABC-type dipeptide transport system, periplasmic component [Phaeobacter gallaeciensis]ATF23388.1 ABC-type dipeptide transport system, periplasmic component [Phaeobacter gallaeciensis]
MPNSSRTFWSKMLAATCFTTAAFFGPAAAEPKTEMVIAAPFGPKSSVPDPRARQNGWLSNRAGVSETLIGIGYDMTLQPRLATGFENLSEREWKITLRKGVKFHDGTNVTAQAVKESFEKLSEEGHPGNNPRLVKLLNIESIELLDDNTLVFRTHAPNSAFLWSLTEPSAAVMKDGTEAMPLVGTGPFVFEKAETEKTYVVTGFADYWSGAPKLDRLVIDAIGDPSVAALALQAGDVDLVTNYPEPDFAKLLEEGKGQLFSEATARLFFFQPRVNGGPLSNQAVLNAVSLGLDRDTIVAATLAGVGGQSANGIFPASMKSWVNDDISLSYDPVKAQSMLDEAGIIDSDSNGIRELNGEDIVLKIRSYEGRAALRPTLEISQIMLQQIGLGAEIAMGEFGANNEALKAGEIDLHLQAWGTAPQGDPDYFPSTLVATGGSYNVSGYSNPELDALLERGRGLFSSEERKPVYAEVQAIINRDLPLIPLFHKTQVSVGNGKVEGYRIHPAETYLANPELAIAE